MKIVSLWLCCVALVFAGQVHTKDNSTENKLTGWFKDFFKNQSTPQKDVYGLFVYRDTKWNKFEKKVKQSRAVMLIHGLNDPGFFWNDLAAHLDKTGALILKFQYPNDQGIHDSAKMFFEHLGACRKLGVEHVSIVAHSMGGLVTREVLTHPDFYAGTGISLKFVPVIDRFIMVGTPNHGSEFSRFHLLSEMGEHAIHLVRGEFNYLRFLEDGDGQAADDLLPGSPFLKELNQRPLARHVDHSIIAGKIGSKAINTLQSWLTDFKNKGRRLKQYLDKVSAGMTTSSDIVGDGVVTINSAKLAGVKDIVVVPGNHISILYQFIKGDAPAPAIPEILKRVK